MKIRLYQSSDLDELKRITIEGFEGIAIDQSVEAALGILSGHDEHALDYFRREGMGFAMIETMDNNPVGQHLYPSCGFVETCRQIHFAKRL